MNFVWKQRLKTESKKLQLIFKKTGINGQCKINHEYAKREQSAGKSLSSNDIAVHPMSKEYESTLGIYIICKSRNTCNF